MKMKKSIVYLLAATLFLAGGCNEDNFLKENPRDEIYTSNLLVDKAGFESILDGLRGLMRSEYLRTGNIGGGSSSMPLVWNLMWACGVDNAWSNNTHSNFKFLYYPKYIQQTDMECMLVTFEWLYKVVNTANVVITRAERSGIDWGGSDEAGNRKNKETIVAKARLIRAWAYRHLTYSWGDVPLSTEEITGMNYRTDWERTPVARIREVMEADWLYAIEKLPMRETSNAEVSGALARHYLGELYLAIGQPEKAEEILRPLATGNEYALMTERFGSNASQPGNAFIDLFRSPLYSQGNREVILAFLNTEPENSAYGTADLYMKSSWKNYYSNDAEIKKSNKKAPEVADKTINNVKMLWLVNGGKGAGRANISLGALRLYDYKNQGEVDDRCSGHALVWTIYEKNAAGEIVEYLKDGKSVIDTTVTPAMLDDNKTTIQNYRWPSTRKWDYVQTVAANGDADPAYNDVPYVRLAETYLLYAEALYKLGDARAIDWINKIRVRSHAVALAKSDLDRLGLDLILDERSRELISEEQRRHTLVRLSQENGGDERDVNNYFKRRVRELNEICGRQVRGMGDYDTPVLFPIPKVFIDANTDKVVAQNPGY